MSKISLEDRKWLQQRFLQGIITEETWLSIYRGDIEGRFEDKYVAFKNKYGLKFTENMIELDELSAKEISFRKNLLELKKQLKSCLFENSKEDDELAIILEKILLEHAEYINIFSAKIICWENIINLIKEEQFTTPDIIKKFIVIPLDLFVLKSSTAGLMAMNFVVENQKKIHAKLENILKQI